MPDRALIVCDPQELPPPEHRWMRCGGCGAFWWNDGECACRCVDGDDGFETWVEVMAAMRDASWLNSPGRAWRYHVALGDEDVPTSACNQRQDFHRSMPLSEYTYQLAVEVPERMRCRRPGCRVRWPAS